MANFDSIRTSHLGPIAYLCKERTSPPELLGLWTLGNGVTTDLSRYGGTCNFNYTPTNTSEYGFPLATISGGGKSTTVNLGVSLNLSKDWSWEAYFRDASGRPLSDITIGDVRFVAGDRLNPDGSDNASMFVGGSRIACSGSWRNPKGTIHRAIQYTASDSTLRMYKNGSIQSSVVHALSGELTMFAYVFESASYSDGDTTWGIGNIRICQKALGTSTTFPTPAGLYTGLEPI